jgi:hypothetical protein
MRPLRQITQLATADDILAGILALPPQPTPFIVRACRFVLTAGAGGGGDRFVRLLYVVGGVAEVVSAQAGTVADGTDLDVSYFTGPGAIYVNTIGALVAICAPLPLEMPLDASASVRIAWSNPVVQDILSPVSWFLEDLNN